MGEPRHFPKLIYLARRNPRLSAEEFTPRWRQHGRLGMSMPRWIHVRRYGHCDVARTAPAGIATDADGIGLIWYRNAEARAKNAGDTTSQRTMETDEAETFAELVRYCAVVTTEAVLRPGPRTPFKLMSFVKAAPGVDEARLAAFVEGTYAPKLLAQTLGTAAGIVRYAANYRSGADPLVKTGLDFDLVEELWFSNEADRTKAAAAFETFAAANSGGVLGPRKSYFTNDIIHYDQE